LTQFEEDFGSGLCAGLPGTDFHLEDQRELREFMMGASVTILVFGALAAVGLL
jgi:hypothetical protein